MKKVVYGLLMSALFLGACGSNNAEDEYEYDPFGSTGTHQSNEESSTSTSDDTTESSLRQEISDLKSENEELNKRVTVLKNLIENSSTDDSASSTSGDVKINQSVDFTSGESITVTEVKADDSISLMAPQDGEHPVVVTAIVENKTSSPISFNAHTFDIYDGNNELGRLDANTYSNNIPNEIAGGKKATVVMYFGAKGNAPYSVTYGPATWSE